MSKTKKVAKVSKIVKPPKAVPVKARDWTKTLVVFDTNVFKACPDIQKGTWQTFREIARRLQFRVAVPQVVLDELFSQKFRDQDKTLSEYKNKLESVINLLHETSNTAHELYATDLDVNILTKLRKISLNKMAEERLADAIKNRLRITFGRTFDALPISDVPHSEIFEQIKKTFKPFAAGGTGYKDYLLWRSTADTMISGAYDYLIFISANTSDFAEFGTAPKDVAYSLHADLKTYLTEKTKVSCFSQLSAFNSALVNESLPIDTKSSELLNGIGKGKFQTAIRSRAIDLMFQLNIWDQLNDGGSMTGSPMVLIDCKDAFIVSKTIVLARVEIVYGFEVLAQEIVTTHTQTYQSKPNTLQITHSVPGVKKAYKLEVDVVYNHSANAVDEMSIQRVSTVACFKLQLSVLVPPPIFHNNQTVLPPRIWNVQGIHSECTYQRTFSNFTELKNCMTDLGAPSDHLASLETGFGLVNLDAEFCTEEVLSMWRFEIDNCDEDRTSKSIKTARNKSALAKRKST